jgi:hypothetical protein
MADVMSALEEKVSKLSKNLNRISEVQVAKIDSVLQHIARTDAFSARTDARLDQFLKAGEDTRMKYYSPED